MAYVWLTYYKKNSHMFCKQLDYLNNVIAFRYDLKDDRLRKICYLIKRSFKVVDMSGGIINFFPYLRHIIPGYTGYRELKELHHSMYMFIKVSSFNLIEPLTVLYSKLWQINNRAP